jgi:hypothetical protein
MKLMQPRISKSVRIMSGLFHAECGLDIHAERRGEKCQATARGTDGGCDWTAGILACNAREATVRRRCRRIIVVRRRCRGVQAGMPAVQSVADVCAGVVES